MRAERRPVALLLAGLALFACATPRSDDEVRALLRRAAGAEAGARIVALNPGTRAEAMVLVVEARSSGPIVASRRLALGFAEAARQRVHYVVGGAYARLNDRVLIDAFATCKERRLSGLRLTLVSPEPPSAELVETARLHRASLSHRPYVDEGR